ncbi:MAG: hypothetical protein NW703_12410 [Nitrospiraceae bacterium]
MVYLLAAEAVTRRSANTAKLAAELETWHDGLVRHWHTVRFGEVRTTQAGQQWHFVAQVFLGDLDPGSIRVELYADPLTDHDLPTRIVMSMQEAIPGSINGYFYAADCPATRPPHHFTPRLVPYHVEGLVPIEESHILWKR